MKFELTSEQTKVVSSIFANLGYIFFASTVIPFLISPGVSENLWLVLSGISVALCLWAASITSVKGI